MIDIYVGAVGPETKPYRVPQAVLESISTYFTKALRSDTFKEGCEGCIRFPDDDADAWEVLLFWMLKFKLPYPLGTELVMIECWALGDKYAIPAFQDEAMLQLIGHYQNTYASAQGISKALQLSTPGSKMRKLIAEELVLRVYQAKPASQWSHGELEATVDGTGIIGEFLSTYQRFQEDAFVFRQRLTKLSLSEVDTPQSKRRAKWGDYLVGEPPAKHWIYEMQESNSA